jgi:phage head maturation protease
MVMQQFGVPAPSRFASERRVVWSQDITRSLAERETLADGRVVTIPVGDVAQSSDRNRILEFSREEMMRPN